MLMLSMPPATTTSASPRRIWAAPRATAARPLPQTLLTVRAGTEGGRPAPIAAWRAGAMPSPAGRTQPMMTFSTASGADSGPLHGGPHGDGPQLGGAEGGQGAEELPHRGAGGGDDHHVIRLRGRAA